MKAIEIREKYLEYFKSKGHSIIKGASLVPENDPTVLFTTARNASACSIFKRSNTSTRK